MELWRCVEIGCGDVWRGVVKPHLHGLDVTAGGVAVHPMAVKRDDLDAEEDLGTRRDDKEASHGDILLDLRALAARVRLEVLLLGLTGELVQLALAGIDQKGLGRCGARRPGSNVAHVHRTHHHGNLRQQDRQEHAARREGSNTGQVSTATTRQVQGWGCSAPVPQHEHQEHVDRVHLEARQARHQV